MKKVKKKPHLSSQTDEVKIIIELKLLHINIQKIN